MKKRIISQAVAGAMLAMAGSANAFLFETENIKGAFTSTVFAGVQYSLEDVDPTLNTNNNGNNKANYANKSVPSANIRGIHELDLQFPNEWAVFGRATWVRDFEMADTKTPLHPDAKDEAESSVRLLDLFVEKGYAIGDQFGRVRVGNQVLNWGESLFHFGGINYATNPVDIQSATLPGGQIKEILVPVPMITINQGLTDALSVEAYYQFDFEPHRFPPVDTYWSTTNLIGEGSLLTASPTEGGFGGVEDDPDAAQYGFTLQYQSEDSPTTYGFYYARYNEKFPWVRWDTSGTPNLTFAEGIDMYALSMNTDLGEWAVGAELAYRPNDVIALDPLDFDTGCGATLTTCLREQERWSVDVTAINLLTPNGPMGWLLNTSGADSGIFLFDVAASYVPGLNPSGTDVKVALDSSKSLSWGYAMEANVAYEGSLIPGWTVSPGVFFRHNVSGSSHELLGWWRNEAKEANVYLNFVDQDDLTLSLQYLTYWGGNPKRVVDNRDKDVIAFTVSKTF
ncbi:MAG: DUF1302 family protein [Motiliproteus sp.]